MKKSRKILAVLCATLMAATMCVPAFAAGSEANTPTGTNITGVQDGSNSEEITIALNATLAEAPNPTYSVNVAWGNMTFTFTGTQASEWDAATHTYKQPAGGSWTGGSERGDSSQIIITNNSDVPVQARATYEEAISGHYPNDTKYNGVKVVVDGECVTAAKKLVAGTTDNVLQDLESENDTRTKINVTVEGTPEKAIQNLDVATVTIKISAAAN